MIQPTRSLRLLMVALLASICAGYALGAPTVVGEWHLVEQTYGEGRSNLVAGEAEAVRLEFSRDGASILGRIGRGAAESTALSWPRLTPDGSRAVQIQEKRFSAAEDSVRVRYRVDPSAGDDLVLEVTEEYRVVEGGGALVGTVQIRFRRGGSDRGSYVLHRRFERER